MSVTQIIRIGEYNKSLERYDSRFDVWFPTLDAEKIFTIDCIYVSPVQVGIRPRPVASITPAEKKYFFYDVFAFLGVESFPVLTEDLKTSWVKKIIQNASNIAKKMCQNINFLVIDLKISTVPMKTLLEDTSCFSLSKFEPYKELERTLFDL